MSWQKKETSKLENRSTGISQFEKQNGKGKKKKTDQRLRNLWDTIKNTDLHITDRRQTKGQSIWRNYGKKFLKFGKKKKTPHIQEAQKVSNRINSKKTHTNMYNQTVEREESNLSQIKAPPKTNSYFIRNHGSDSGTINSKWCRKKSISYFISNKTSLRIVEGIPNQ